jgi:glycosyltransferase involved in cell wall biosynthesis
LSDPLVSVIIPFFEARRFLAEAVESVLAQSYAPLELLLVDDGSTDGSADSVASLVDRHDRVHLLRLSCNQGPAAARNVALRQARGGFVTFLDADDLMVADRIAFQVDYLRTHPGIDVVMGLAKYDVEPGIEPPRWLRERQSSNPSPYQNPMTMLARRAVFDRVGLFDPSYRVGEDTEWALRAAGGGTVIATVNRILIRRRFHGANLTYETARMRDSIRRIVLGLARDRIADRKRV